MIFLSGHGTPCLLRSSLKNRKLADYVNRIITWIIKVNRGDRMNKRENIFLITAFILIIGVFTSINLFEFAKASEKDGRRIGLSQMETVRDSAVTLWGGVQRVTGRKEVLGTTDYSNVVDIGGGYYILTDPSQGIEAGKTGTMQGKALADELGIPFLYVLAPVKQQSDEVPEGVEDYALVKYESFASWLSGAGVDYVDMGKVYREANDDYRSFFYKTDHHASNKGAFLTYQKVCEWMKAQGFVINEEYASEDSYEVKHYEDVFLGSGGRMVGPMYTGLDDYDLYVPKYDCDYTLRTPSQGIERTGGFEDALVYYENLDGYSYDYYAYYAYLGEDYDVTSIINNGNSEGPHIVIFRDSTAVPVSCFLISQCSQVDLISLKYVQDRSTIKDYVVDQNPDAIIYMFGTGFLGDETAFTW